MKKVIGTVTIGQAPRTDVIPEKPEILARGIAARTVKELIG